MHALYLQHIYMQSGYCNVGMYCCYYNMLNITENVLKLKAQGKNSYVWMRFILRLLH